MQPETPITSFLCWGDVGWDVYLGAGAVHPGGCALNVAISLAASGGSSVACAAPLGPDGRPLLEALEEHGIEAGLVEMSEAGATPRQSIRIGPDGERDLCGYRRGVLDGYRPGSAVLEAVSTAGLVYVPVFDLTIPLAEEAWARRPDAPVAVDLMDLVDVTPHFVERALQRSSLVFAGLHPERHATWIERLEALAARPGAALTVVTLGPAGARAFSSEGRHSIPAAPVPGRVLDTTGCGDAFAGAFIASWGRGEGISSALAAGAARAAAVAARRGAF